MVFWFYENWTVDNMAVIHRGDCSYCNNGQGRRQTRVATRNGKWHGPFETLTAATNAAKATGHPAREHNCPQRRL